MKNVKGKIILIDDEPYEEDFLRIALARKNWNIQIEYFKNVTDALEHLKIDADAIFLIICDIELPIKSGMDLKEILDKDEYLAQKSIPFIFISNYLTRSLVLQAYKYHVQGVFEKPMTSEKQAEMFEIIVQYWITCIHPNKDDLPENPFLTTDKM